MQVADRLGIGLGGLCLAEAEGGDSGAARQALLEALSLAAKAHSV